MKRDVTVGPSLAESHLTILQAVSAKQKQLQGQSPAQCRLAITRLLPRPCLPCRQLPRSQIHTLQWRPGLLH